MGKTWYSYYDLVRKDARFDCLKSLACGFKSLTLTGNPYSNGITFFTNFRGANFASFSFGAVFLFAPIAEVKPGVLIRGDRLKDYRTGAVYNPLDRANTGTISYSVRLSNSGSVMQATGWSIRGFTSGVEKASISDSSSSDRLVSLEVDPENLGHMTASVNIELYPRDLANMTGFENWFPNQSVGLDDLDNTPFFTYTLTAETSSDAWSRYSDYYYSQHVLVQGFPETSTGNPVSSPLFTIPFRRSNS